MGLDQRPLTISVVVPVYNRAAVVREAIDSVLSQTRRPDEIIVVDDGSTDDTPKVLAEYGDRIRCLHKPNGGAASARNLGVRHAKGDWIAFLDSDDIWLPSHLADLEAVLNRHPDLVWACSNRLDQTTAGGELREPCERGLIERFVNSEGIIEDYYGAVAVVLPIGTPGYLIRRDVLLDEGGFDETLAHGEDMDLWWRIAAHHYRIGFAWPASWVYRRYGADSLTRIHGHDVPGLMRLLERHLELARQANRGQAFKPLAIRLANLAAYMAFEVGNIEVMRCLSAKHSHLLRREPRLLVWLSVLSPTFGYRFCRRIRRLGLRFWVVLRPWIRGQQSRTAAMVRSDSC